MSITDKELTETKFPDELDTMERMSDLDYAHKDLAIQYYAYKNVGNDSAAAQLLLDNPTLNTMILNAEKINKYQDIALALERFFKNDVEGYLEARFTYKEAYDPEITYVKGNIVDSNGEGFICRVDSSIGESPAPHTNNDNWAIIAKQGIQGVSGIGLSPRGVWNRTTTYYVDDCVADGNALWQCLIENTDSKPTNENINWLKLFDSLDKKYVDTKLAELMENLSNYSSYASNKDANGKFVKVCIKRQDGTLCKKSILSGGTSPRYTTRTETRYKDNGTTVDRVLVYKLTYDADNKITSEVLQ